MRTSATPSVQPRNPAVFFGNRLPSAPFFQAKRTVGPAHDAFEAEADRVAEAAVWGGSFVQPKLRVNPTLQRTCARCGEDEKAVQRKGSGEVSTATPAVEAALAQSGQALDATTRQWAESRFGHDFSSVKIHHDAEAAQSATSIGARAYTSGRDIVFGAGEFSPHTESGRRLLAHELAHVVQQQGVSGPVQRDGMGDVRLAEGYHELLNTLKTSAKFKGLNADQSKLTNDLLAEIEKQPNWPTRYGLAVKLELFFQRSVKKATLDAAKPDLLALGLDATKLTALLDELAKPFFGYVASGYDFSSRFFGHAGTLGFSVENPALGAYNADPYDRGQPAAVTSPAETSFGKSDILFFSGHQYAQYREPGNFTNDSSTSCFNIGMISKANTRVKLVVSTSCATVCKDVAKIWQAKFPDALILGYRYSAPTDGSVVSNAFAKKLVALGPLDLADAGSRQGVRDAWKAVVLGPGSIGGGPGLLFGGEVEFYNQTTKKWVKTPWDDKANDCHYH